MDQNDHKQLGITLFNKTWNFIDMTTRSVEENFEMIHTAHASRLHWELAGGSDLNLARGEWLIAKVYNTLNRGHSALLHAKESLRLVEKNQYGDFDLVFAYEAVATAYKILGDNQKKKLYLDLGYKALQKVEKIEDKEYCKSELDKI